MENTLQLLQFQSMSIGNRTLLFNCTKIRLL